MTKKWTLNTAAAALIAVVACAALAQSGSRVEHPEFDKWSTESKRTIFITEYQEMMARVSPSLNYIKTGARKVKGGYLLYAEHPMLNRYSFSAGALGPAVEAWVSKYAYKLRTAGIARVGIRTDEGAEIWFNTY